MATTIKPYAYTAGALTLVGVFCAKCGVAFGLASHYEKERRRDHESFYCPNQHSQYFPQETEEERLRRDNKSLRDRNSALIADRDQIEASRRAYKGQATRLRNRAIAGECPLCGRHLRDLERHMHRQHPDEQPETETDA